MNPKGKDREGHVAGNVLALNDNNGTRDKVHIERSINPTADLYSMEAYQSRFDLNT
jgi:hypothetical protein